MGAFKEPHGGELRDRYLDPTAAKAEKQAARDYASWDLAKCQLCDIWTPDNAEMVIDSVDISPDLAAHRILAKLQSMGVIR